MTPIPDHSIAALLLVHIVVPATALLVIWIIAYPRSCGANGCGPDGNCSSVWVGSCYGRKQTIMERMRKLEDSLLW